MAENQTHSSIYYFLNNNRYWDLSEMQTHSSFYGCFLLPARMKKFHSKMEASEPSQHFSNHKSMGIVEFKNHQRFNGCPRYLNEEDPITNEGARVVTLLYIDISDCQGQLTQ